MKQIDQGFMPILGPAPKVLILGSMPSVKSLDSQQYYAHPQNSFWWIMSELFSFNLLEPYDVRAKLLKQHKLAVWDVIKSCHRPGSLDSAIDAASVEANDFSKLLNKETTIQLVIFNGQAAQKIFKKHVLALNTKKSHKFDQSIHQYKGEFVVMPSTSPANASTKRHEKLAQWRALIAHL